MLAESKRQINTFLKDSINRLAMPIDYRAKSFDKLFREMVNSSKLQFHDMFEKTYGKLYLQNSDIFADFFAELETYYNKGSTRLSDTLESFFVILYRRMFTVINNHYRFDDSYLDCVSDHMKDVKPFGDLPHKFSLQLKRSFIATRTYYKALSALVESAKRLINVPIDKDCDREIVRMRHCGPCRGLRGEGTCSNYCAAVIQKCLRHHVEFGTEWDIFVAALDRVGERLVGPYNIENVVHPLNIKVSEAIMHFQESQSDVTKKIFTLCGQPSMSRRRRASSKDDYDDDPSFEVSFSPLKVDGRGHKKDKDKRRKLKKNEEEDRGPSLERLVKEIKTKVHETLQFWPRLPYQFCNNLTAAPSSNGRCWNGTSVGEYASSGNTPGGDTPIVKEQIFLLQQFTDQLQNAYRGEEVKFIDDSEDSFDGSGSGSGDFEVTDEEASKEHPKIDDIAPIDEMPNEVSSSTTRAEPAPAGRGATISLNRALAQFLLPVVLVWFGGAISDLL